MQLSCAKGGARRGAVELSKRERERVARGAHGAERRIRRWCSLRPAGLHNLDYFALASARCEKQPSGPEPSATDAARRPGVGLYVCQVNTLTLTPLAHPSRPIPGRWHKIFIARRMRPVVVEVQISIRSPS